MDDGRSAVHDEGVTATAPPSETHRGRRATSWRRTLLLALLVSIAAAAFGVLDVRQRARLDRGLSHHHTDFTVYQAAARALRDGTDPYQARSPRGYRYVYPPLLAVLLMPVARWSAPDAAMVFYALSVLALWVTLLCVARLPTPARPAGIGLWPTLLGASVCVFFLAQSFERGQVTIVLLALQAGALLALTRERFLLGGLLLAVGGVLRLTPFLPAAAVMAGALAARRRAAIVPLAAGLLLGAGGGFAVVPAAVLGPQRAITVSRQWLAATDDVFAAEPGAMAPLDHVNEYRFKNQSPRRVLATWTGWITGAAFEDERPALDEAGWRFVDAGGYAIAAALGVLALLLGVRLRDPTSPTYGITLAVVLVLPLAMTRYAWPTHETIVLPAVALACSATADGQRLAPRAALAFVTAVVLFYLAHTRPLQPIGAAGPLLAGGIVLAVALLRRGAPLKRLATPTR